VADQGSNTLWKEIGNYALLHNLEVDRIKAAEGEYCQFLMHAKMCDLGFFFFPFCYFLTKPKGTENFYLSR